MFYTRNRLDCLFNEGKVILGLLEKSSLSRQKILESGRKRRLWNFLRQTWFVLSVVCFDLLLIWMGGKALLTLV